jgi:hypothetical protein
VAPGRERKKEKVQTLQAAVAALSQRLEDLSSAKQLNAQLRERTALLQQALSQQQRSSASASALHDSMAASGAPGGGGSGRCSGSQEGAQSVRHAQPSGQGTYEEDDDNEREAAADAVGVAINKQERLRDLVSGVGTCGLCCFGGFSLSSCPLLRAILCTVSVRTIFTTLDQLGWQQV